MRNAHACTSQPTDPSRGGRIKARALRGHTQGWCVRDEGGDPVQGGEDAAWSLSRFEVDRHPFKMMALEMNLIRELYQVPDFVEFRLPGPSN